MDIIFLKNKYADFLTAEQDFQKVGWGSQESQYKRFSILSQISNDFLNSVILDYGCGLGAFYAYLKQQNFKGTYLGYDLLEDMIHTAQKKYPKACFKHSIEEESPDYTVASGIFTFSNFESMCQEIEKIFKISQKGVAFNALSSLSISKESGEFYPNPAEVLEFCLNLTSKAKLIHDYLPHDFTIYLYK